jgi:hypothetical protein
MLHVVFKSQVKECKIVAKNRLGENALRKGFPVEFCKSENDVKGDKFRATTFINGKLQSEMK